MVKGRRSPRSALDELACEGARRMLTEALAAEVAGYIERHRPVRDEGGRALVVRNGRAEERQVIVGSGPMKIPGAARERQTCREWGAATVHEPDPAAVPSQVEGGIGVAPRALPARAIDRRFP